MSGENVDTIWARGTGMKATIWRYQNDNSVWYKSTVTQTYKNANGEFGDSTEFDEKESLVAAQLRIKASNRIFELKEADYQKTKAQKAA